ncbi:hypothetical protein SAY86_027884 [Trapa natans]|uniref:Uncharacterized protein n=1 Tax=Trapa natans TaxID=22666 RepID=A0AAN7RFM3_TRANT|nr:hypothetical protein SAY86_027884 [Trapa natans]
MAQYEDKWINLDCWLEATELKSFHSDCHGRDSLVSVRICQLQERYTEKSPMVCTPHGVDS